MDNAYPVTNFNNADIATQLDTPVFQEVISKRAGRGNTTLSYLRGDIIAHQLNSIFGPLGWDLRAAVPVMDHWEGEKEVGGYNNQAKKLVQMHTVQVMTQMTLRIKARSAEDSDTIFTQTGIGYGEIETTKNRKEVVGMALKGAETDGFKRCASLLGRAMGMFLTGTGSQDEIDYAHNGKDNDIKKGKAMRQDRLRHSGGQAPRLEDRREERREERPALQDQRSSGNRNDSRSNDRQDDRSNAGRQNDRQDTRGNDDRQDNRSQQEERQPAKPDPKPAAAKTDAPAKADTQTKAASPAKPEKDSGKEGAAKGAEKSFDLDRLPVTKDEQVDFSRTLLARLEEFNQASDKEKFLRKHFNTIKSLDTKYRRLMIERLAEQKIDFEALGAN
jgi:recombination DNA repair RAD52 pathway protein